VGEHYYHRKLRVFVQKQNKSKNYSYGTPLGSLAAEFVMCLLVIISLIMLVIDFLAHPTPSQMTIIGKINISIALVLFSEFMTRFYLSEQKTMYFKKNWWYLLATIPLPGPVAEALRSVRLIGVVRLVKMSGHAAYEKQQRH
jgi:hypothetical protein